MLSLLPIVCLSPLLAFVVLTAARAKLSETQAAVIGVGSIGVSALCALLLGYAFLLDPPPGGEYTHVLWTWLETSDYAPLFALKLDTVSLSMLGVITGVGFFIHLFAAWYMRGEEGFARFFSYMNLFVASMLILVLADDLLFLYFGWEGVGLCSYLLIGFWYKDPENGLAARKAFIVTRVGDTLMIIGLFVLFREFGTLDIDTILHVAPETWVVGSGVATLTCLLLLGGAVGKSAQLPLQTWLPDAMAGPTPVSALIHAATMVTAGVYLVARLSPLFALSPFALECVGVVGAVTLLLAGFAALVQTDIKRILAYSTMSQIGYMFLAEGVGAYEPAMFHLVTHAFFKALLFLSAGSVILALHHEQDIFRMGGLRHRMPFVFACMLVGSLALSAVPFTSGFYSKDEILHQAHLTGHGGLWLAGLLGAFLTAIYSFRLIFVVFFGVDRSGHAGAPARAPWTHQVPLAVLLLFSIGGGLIHLPLAGVLPSPAIAPAAPVAGFAERVPMIVSLLGIGVAWVMYMKLPWIPAALSSSAATAWLGRWWKNAWGFDWLYNWLFVRPFLALARVLRGDPLDRLADGLAATVRSASRLAVLTQTGGLRYYAAVVGLGVCVLIAVMALR